MTDHETVQEIVQRIVSAAHPEQIILFGSRARDEARDDSDVDLLVIESEPFSAQRSRL
jgi:predicted nucleotidyltransferase